MSDLRTEAVGLLDLLAERLGAAQQTLGAQQSAADQSRPEPQTPCPTCGHEMQQSSCAGCPLCALLAMLRGEKPELTAKLVDSALVALHGIRGMIGDLPATTTSTTPSTTPPAPSTTPPAPSTTPAAETPRAPAAERIIIR